MENLLAHLGIFGTALAFLAMLLTIIGTLRFLLTHRGQKTKSTDPKHTLLATKKYHDVDIHQYSGAIRNVSLALSIGIALAMMEFPSTPNDSLVELTSENQDVFEEMQDVPVTEQPPPPPPEQQEIRGAEIIEVDDAVEIEELNITFDTEFDEEMAVEENLPTEAEGIEIEEEEEEEVYLIVEEPAVPEGGYEAFYAYVQDELKYPSRALKSSVQGKVYINFIVDKNGNITELKIARGIGSGCDEEAIRVLKNAPKWVPAKQRGRNVKQSIVIPIHFKINDL